MTEVAMEERTIKAQFFRYTQMLDVRGEFNADGSQKQRPVVKTARRNETVKLDAEDIARGDDTGSFFDSPTVVETADGEEVVEVDIREMSDTDLAKWVKNDKPTVDEMVDYADNDAALAERLLNAERTATGGKIRSTLNSRLTAIMDAAAAGGTVPVTPEGTP